MSRKLGNPIRVPRTTAMFVTGLARILRDEFGLKITEHEHWTFEHVAVWVQCTDLENCYDHNRFAQGDYSWCYPYEMTVYLAVGQARVRGQHTELRARIERTHRDGQGYLYHVQIWTFIEGGSIIAGHYGLCEDGTPYVLDGREMPAEPPRRIAFWRPPTELANASS